MPRKDVSRRFMKVSPDMKTIRANISKAMIPPMGKPKGLSPLAAYLHENAGEATEEELRREFQEICKHRWELMSSLKLSDVARYHYRCPICGGYEVRTVKKP